MSLLVMGGMYDVTVYLGVSVQRRKIQVTPAQKKLLGVQNTGQLLTD